MKRYYLMLALLAAFGVTACDDSLSDEPEQDPGVVIDDDQDSKDKEEKKDPGEDKKGDDDPENLPEPDSDGDTIGDAYEMYKTYYDVAMFGPDETQEFRDTDKDGTPDYLDLDSDGDTIPDSLEALNDGLGDAPFYGAGQYPAYRSADSDANGIPDNLECIWGKDLLDTPDVLAVKCDDSDGDTIPDFADKDDDNDTILDYVEITGMTDFSAVSFDCNGDTIPEVNGTAEHPFDCDGDTIPDFRDTDSDNDTVADKYEGLTDADGDGIYNIYESDSDGDSVSDKDEFGSGQEPVDTDNDTIVDMNDRDSDDDGLGDELDIVCDNLDKHSRLFWDTDGDGTSDMAEYVFAKANGKEPKELICNADISAKNFVEFYFELPLNAEDEKIDTLDFQPLITKADILVNIDHTGSMGSMIKAIQDNFSTVVAPEVQKRVPDTYFGVSIFGDYDTSNLWKLIQDMTSDITDFQAKLGTVQAKPDFTDAPEAGYESFYKIADNGVTFRKGSLPIVLHITDSEPKSDSQAKSASSQAHTSGDAIAKLNSIGARVLPLYNTHNNADANIEKLASESKLMAKNTNARVPVCAFKKSDNTWLCGENKCCTNAKIMERGYEKAGEDPDADGYCNVAFESDIIEGTTKALDGGSSNKINVLAWQTTIGVEALVKYSTYTVSTRVLGEPLPEKDAVSADVDTSCFITKIEADAYQPPSQEPEKSCAALSKPTAFDFGGKGYLDAFKNFAVGAATPESPTSTLSFKVYAKNNQCVKSSEEVRMYYATIEVYDPVTGLSFDKQRVAIIVPGEYKQQEIVY